MRRDIFNDLFFRTEKLYLGASEELFEGGFTKLRQTEYRKSPKPCGYVPAR